MVPESNYVSLRVVTYNVHGCRGRDGVISPLRIASVISEAAPDVIALQELDVGRARSGGLDQAQLIARELGMQFHFAPAMRVLEESYGDAILTAFPIRLIKAAPLPGIRFPVRLEPRGALWTEIMVRGLRLQMMTTHLGLVRRERAIQTAALCGREWLSDPRCDSAVVLAGDFNFLARSSAYARLSERLCDVHRGLLVGRPGATFPARFPRFRIDYIFASNDVIVDRVQPLRSSLTGIASDHLPLVADLRFPVRVNARQSTREAVAATDA